MKKILPTVLLSVLLTVLIHSQESSSMLDTFLRNFARASLSTKVKILEDSEKLNPSEMGPLYVKAVEFILSNSDLIQTDSMTQQLSVLAARLMGLSGYKEGRYRLWELFHSDKDRTVRIVIMTALGDIGKGDARILEGMNNWLSEQTSLFQTGKIPDLPVVGECIVSLGKIGDPSSFPVIFTSMVVKFSDDITAKAQNSLLSIEGDFKDSIVNVLKRNPIPDKLAALQMAVDSPRLSDEQKGEVAEVALDIGLTTTSQDVTQRANLTDLRYTAVRVLTEKKWSKATRFIIDHFDVVLDDYRRGTSPKANLLEAINALGAMGTHEAAEHLSLYMVTINNEIEKGLTVDEQIVLTVIRNLGNLGDKIASDCLLYAGYLNYSDPIKRAAREAFNNLKIR
ncbi:MAG: hypothetical protein AB1798_14215 [Spirochaetota bacterium]